MRLAGRHSGGWLLEGLARRASGSGEMADSRTPRDRDDFFSISFNGLETLGVALHVRRVKRQPAQAGGKIPVPRLHSPLHRFTVCSNIRLRGRLQLYAGFTAMASPSCE